MTKVQGISNSANQLFTIFLPDGESFQLTLKFSPMQTGWFCGVEYKDFKVEVLRVCNSPNILAQFSHLLPFGLACFLTSNREPFFQEDFSAGNAALCVMD